MGQWDAGIRACVRYRVHVRSDVCVSRLLRYRGRPREYFRLLVFTNNGAIAPACDDTCLLLATRSHTSRAAIAFRRGGGRVFLHARLHLRGFAISISFRVTCPDDSAKYLWGCDRKKTNPHNPSGRVRGRR